MAQVKLFKANDTLYKVTGETTDHIWGAVIVDKDKMIARRGRPSKFLKNNVVFV